MGEITELSRSNEPFYITVYADDDQADREQYIAENPLCQLWYDVIDADIKCGINQHPQKQMKELGYTVLDAVPESIADGWRFTVDKFIEPLPSYLQKIRYDIDDKKPLHCGNVFTDTLGCALSKAKRKRYTQNSDGTYTIELDVNFADADSEKQYPGTLTYCIDSMDVFGDENTLVSEGWQKVDTLQALIKDAIFQMIVEGHND